MEKIEDKFDWSPLTEGPGKEIFSHLLEKGGFRWLGVSKSAGDVVKEALELTPGDIDALISESEEILRQTEIPEALNAKVRGVVAAIEASLQSVDKASFNELKAMTKPHKAVVDVLMLMIVLYNL